MSVEGVGGCPEDIHLLIRLIQESNYDVYSSPDHSLYIVRLTRTAIDSCECNCKTAVTSAYSSILLIWMLIFWKS